jgi:hypothetical protein
MKQLAVSLCALVLLTLSASPLSSQVRLAIKGGVNIASVKFNKDIISSENITGFHVGPMLEVITPVLGLGFDASVLYSQRGVDGAYETYKTDNIDVPVNLRWKISPPLIENLIRFYIAGGPYISFRVGEKHDAWGAIQNQFSSKTFGAGLNLGAGVELFSRIQVGFTYGLGLTDNFSYKQVSAKEKNMMITAALLF